MVDSNGLTGRLLAGERALWTGRPARGLIFTARDAFLLPFSVLWCGFIVFWIAGVLASGGGFFALFGVAMLSFGLFFMFGRFALDAHLREHTEYMLTDKRILISRTGLMPSFKAVSLDRLPEAEINERPDGRGTVRFGQQLSPFAFAQSGMSIWTPALDPVPQFMAIPEARRVFDLVQLATARGS